MNTTSFFEFQGGNRLLLIIAGGSCAGKTTLASVLSEFAISKNLKPFVLSQDNYFLDFNDVTDLACIDFDIPNAYDNDMLIKNVKSILRGQLTEIPEYDFLSHKRECLRRTDYVPDVLIVEGLFSLYLDELVALSKMKIFIEIDNHAMLSRRVRRDVNERGFTADEIIERHNRFIKPRYQELIYPTRLKADFNLSGKKDFLEQLEIVGSRRLRV